MGKKAKPIEVFFLVHPFFFPFKNIYDQITFSPQEIKFRKKLLSVWGKAAIQQARRKQPFIVLLDSLMIEAVELAAHTMSGFEILGEHAEAGRIRKLLSECGRFFEFIRPLSVFLDARNPAQGVHNFFQTLRNKNVDVKVFGEYESVCVSIARKLVAESLKRTGKTGNVEIVKEWCRDSTMRPETISYKGTTYFRMFRTKHERRKLQQKKKQKKLRQNRKK